LHGWNPSTLKNEKMTHVFVPTNRSYSEQYRKENQKINKFLPCCSFFEQDKGRLNR